MCTSLSVKCGSFLIYNWLVDITHPTNMLVNQRSQIVTKITNVKPLLSPSHCEEAERNVDLHRGMWTKNMFGAINQLWMYPTLCSVDAGLFLVINLN